MTIEEKLPEKFKVLAFHPSLFTYAFKRNVLDKLFEEFLQSNIAIEGGEAWVTADDKYFGVIPLRNGDKTVLNWKITKVKGEEWFDYVERSIKESLNIITSTDLEKKVSAGIRNRLFYHFKLVKVD